MRKPTPLGQRAETGQVPSNANPRLAPKARWRDLLVGAGLAGALFVMLPVTAYRTEAIVGVGDAQTPMRGAMAEAAAAAAVSKPVMLRAAASLIGTDVAAPEPGPLAKLLVALGFDNAVGRESRLSETLAGAVGAASGDGPGILRITATATDAGAAAQIATAVAEALVRDQEVEAASLRRRHENEAARQLENLKANALAAHKAFAALGGTDVDPGQAQAASAAQTAAAQARLDVVRGILSSGTPPLSDRRDLPQTVAAMQSAYLDLSQQLAKARETYGERHTVVMSLQDGMKRAAANLTSEWRRLSKVAEADVDRARDHEAALRQKIGPVDPVKATALDEARRAVMVADDAVAQAEQARHEGVSNDRSFRLIAQAPVPSRASGLALPWRVGLALLTGLIAIVALRRLVRAPRKTVGAASRFVQSGADARAAASVEPAVEPQRPSERNFFDSDQEPIETPRAAPRAKVAPFRRRLTGDGDMVDEDRALAAAMFDLLPTLEAITPQGDVPTILVAANDALPVTTSVALALGEAAAEAGLRVLLIESAGSRAMLAAAADGDAEPILIDVLGTLRVALPSAAWGGVLFVAPAFRGGQRMAAGLARSGDVQLVDDLGAEFDLIVIDGGRTAGCVETANYADAFLRVANHPSKREDERMMATLGAASRAFLGTVTASAFVPKQETAWPRPIQTAAVSEQASPPPALRAPHRAAQTFNSVPRRRVGAR